MTRRVPAIATTLGLALAVVATPAIAQSPSAPATGGSGQPIVIPDTYVSPEAATAATPVDTSAFKKDGPWKLCVSAGYLTNSWVVYALQNIKYAASLEPRFEPEIDVTDAGFSPDKQISDLADLLTKGCEAIIYWPANDQAIEPGLEAAVAAGVPTVNVGGGYTDLPGIVSNAYIDQYELGTAGAIALAEALGGQGKIVSMLPIAGTTAAVDQDKALKDVLANYPGIELLDTGNGDWNRAQAKSITETWLQKYPQIDGVYSPAGQMSAGMVEAFDEVGRLGEVKFSPADEYNGWLKWISTHPESNLGLVTFPPAAGTVGVEQMIRILSGEEVTKGIRVPSLWYSPEDAVALYDAAAPEDSWANKLPPEFLPQQ